MSWLNRGPGPACLGPPHLRGSAPALPSPASETSLKGRGLPRYGRSLEHGREGRGSGEDLMRGRLRWWLDRIAPPAGTFCSKRDQGPREPMGPAADAGGTPCRVARSLRFALRRFARRPAFACRGVNAIARRNRRIRKPWPDEALAGAGSIPMGAGDMHRKGGDRKVPVGPRSRDSSGLPLGSAP